MRDPEEYRSVQINKMLWRVFKGDTCIGQVRMGMDGQWYAELGMGDKARAVAIHKVVTANEAIREAVRVLNG